jgi:hypothetical protein
MLMPCWRMHRANASIRCCCCGLGLAAVGQVLLLVGLLRRLDLGVVLAVVAEILDDHVPAELRVGQVDAVLAHAPGERQRRLHAVAAAAGRSGGGGLAGAEAGHPVGLPTAAAAASRGQRQQQPEPDDEPHPGARHRRPPRRPVGVAARAMSVPPCPAGRGRRAAAALWCRCSDRAVTWRERPLRHAGDRRMDAWMPSRSRMSNSWSFSSFSSARRGWAALSSAAIAPGPAVATAEVSVRRIWCQGEASGRVSCARLSPFRGWPRRPAGLGPPPRP